MKNTIVLFSFLLGTLSILSSCHKTNEACSVIPEIDHNAYPMCVECYAPPIKYYFDQTTKECKAYSVAGGVVPFETAKECECACNN